MRLRHVPVLTIALGAMVLSACGSTEEPTTSSGADEEASDTGAAQGPVTVTDSRGEEIVLKAPAEDVVALEWSETEDLVTLGVMPVGVADTKGYSTWVTAAPLDEGVKDVGNRNEPSTDAIVGLEPDLVIMEDDNPTLIAQLEEYVPVLVMKGSNVEDNIGQMRTNLEMIAAATGTEDKAADVLAEFDTTLSEATTAIEEAGVAGTEFAMADGWLEGSTVAIRPFGQGALLTELGEEIGLVNAWTGEVDPTWGLGQTDVEGLTALGDVHFFYVASEEDVFEDGLAENAIWTALPFVQAGKVHELEPGTWMFGGPLSSTAFVEQVVQVVTS